MRLIGCVLAALIALMDMESAWSTETSSLPLGKLEVLRGRSSYVSALAVDRGVLFLAAGDDSPAPWAIYALPLPSSPATPREPSLLARSKSKPTVIGVLGEDLMWLDGDGIGTIAARGTAPIRRPRALADAWGLGFLDGKAFVGVWAEGRQRYGSAQKLQQQAWTRSPQNILRFASVKRAPVTIVKGTETAVWPQMVHVAAGYVYFGTNRARIFRVPASGGALSLVAEDPDRKRVSNPASAAAGDDLSDTMEVPARVTQVLASASFVVWSNELGKVKRQRLDGAGEVVTWKSRFRPLEVCGANVLGIDDKGRVVLFPLEGGEPQTVVFPEGGGHVYLATVRDGFVYWATTLPDTMAVTIARRALTCGT